jgi:choline dehydrogenase-like flavoprotein
MNSFDVCIVGSGAGAAPVAYTLAKRGFKVAVLEKGPWLREEDFSKDEIAVSRRSIYKPLLSEQQHVISYRDEDGERVTVTGAESGWSFWNGSMVGGSSNLMSGYFHRMKPDDFRLRSVYGDIPGGNVVDWPVDYATFEPYYTKVERLVGVSGRVVAHRFQEPRSTPDYPYGPTWEQPISRWFDEACEAMGITSVPTPRAVLPYDALGRSGCSYSNFCGSYGCATGAKGSARAALLDKAVATENCTIITHAFVYRLHDDNAKVSHLSYYDRYGKSRDIHATIFVVAAQAIESARLLLNSKSPRFPNGLANNSGQVGKNLIFSAGGTGEGRFDMDTLPKERRDGLLTRGAFVNRSLQEWYEYEKDGKRLKGGTIDFLYEHANPTARAMGQLYDDEGTMLRGKALQARLRHAFTASRVFTFEVFNDWVPTDACHVSIAEDVTDKWGVPVAKIDLNSHPQDLLTGEFLAKKAVEVLRKMGAVDISYDVSEAPPPNLVAGGCRFGDDPKTSVLDRDCRAHEVRNLYVTDASFMPTGGSVPYTWTIYANAFRVADSILKRLTTNA